MPCQRMRQNVSKDVAYPPLNRTRHASRRAQSSEVASPTVSRKKSVGQWAEPVHAFGRLYALGKTLVGQRPR
jgi:hypothetical protein